MSKKPDHDARKSGTEDVPSSPYGPHPRGTDEAAGGADSSPHETESSDERRANADVAQRPDRRLEDRPNPTP